MGQFRCWLKAQLFVAPVCRPLRGIAQLSVACEQQGDSELTPGVDLTKHPNPTAPKNIYAEKNFGNIKLLLQLFIMYFSNKLRKCPLDIMECAP